MSAARPAAIRLARSEDAEAFPKIEVAAGTLFAALPGFEHIAAGEPISVDRHRRLIAKRHCLVAAAGDQIAGFIACEPFRRELHVWELSVHPDFQRQGLGARLLRGAMIDAHNAGFSAMTLTTFRQVPWNAPFYERLGFIEVEDSRSKARLDALLDAEEKAGLNREQRVAMIRFLA